MFSRDSRRGFGNLVHKRQRARDGTRNPRVGVRERTERIVHFPSVESYVQDN